MTQIIEGRMPFMGYHTYYRLAGDPYSDKTPLIMLHGGPGSTHNFFELFDEMAGRDHRQIITYDQLGCGFSYVENRPDLWTMQTWVQELTALIDYLGLDRFHLFGHSWGGMLALEYYCSTLPSACQSLILSSTAPSSAMWKTAADKLMLTLPEPMQEALRQAQQTDCYEGEAYLLAKQEYMRRYFADGVPSGAPECITRPLRRGSESYQVAWGPDEFTPRGTLSGFDVTDRLSRITVPALILSGEQDMSTPEVADYMASRISRSRKVLFPGEKHLPFIGSQTSFENALTDWMQCVDTGHAVI